MSNQISAKDKVSDPYASIDGGTSKTQVEKQKRKRQKASIRVEHCDIIQDEFWTARPYLLSSG